MTLCIVHRQADQIWVLSDSRVTVGAAGAFDGVPKISPVRVRISSPVDSDTKQSSLLYDAYVGIATVGSTLTTFSTREAIRQLFLNLQEVPPYGPVTFESLGDIVERYFKTISIEACRVLTANGTGVIILAGACPQLRTPMAMSLSVRVSAAGVEVTRELLLQSGTTECFGSGAAAARAKLVGGWQTGPVHLLRSVCEDKNVPSVGGEVQWGIVEDNDFTIIALHSFQVDEARREVRTYFTLGGTEVPNNGHVASGPLFCKLQFWNPYASLLDKYAEQNYTLHSDPPTA